MNAEDFRNELSKYGLNLSIVNIEIGGMNLNPSLNGVVIVDKKYWEFLGVQSSGQWASCHFIEKDFTDEDVKLALATSFEALKNEIISLAEIPKYQDILDYLRSRKVVSKSDTTAILRVLKIFDNEVREIYKNVKHDIL